MMSGAERVRKWRERVRHTEEYKAKKKIENAKRRLRYQKERIGFKSVIWKMAVKAAQMRRKRLKAFEDRYYDADWACRVYKMKLALRGFIIDDL